MDGARYLEDGRLTIFERSGGLLRTPAYFRFIQVSLAITEDHEEKYALYSLRHFYAVMALRNGIGVFEIARNMGTSVQMIQQYYGKQPAPTVFATRLGD